MWKGVETWKVSNREEKAEREEGRSAGKNRKMTEGYEEQVER